MEKKLKYLIPVIIITTLVFPRPAFAFIGTGIFDYFDTALEGIEEFSGPVAKFIFTIFLFYIVGLGALFISSSLLQLVLGNISWLSVTNNPMVLSGWTFVAGITNMFFILIFVFIALATILKIETLAAKKLLPKLLLVALLVNFSLIFVGVIIDISNIFYSTIIGGDTDLIPDIFSVLTKGGEDTLLMIIALIGTLLITFIIPFSSPFAQLALVVLIVATGFIGHLLIWLIQGMMFFMMSGILLVYVFLFAARIFVLQLLAMVAPIAFLCSVLPQTKKYWDDWLKMVVEWNTFGVVTLLFLIVGLRGASAIIPPAALSGISFSGATLFWGDLPGYFTYYFFLFVYLVALLYFSQKYSPQMADMLIRQGKAMGGMIYAKGLKPMGGMLKSSYKDVVRRQPEAEKELERKRAEGKKARLLAFRVGAGKVLTRPAKWAARGRGTTLEKEQAKEVEKDMAKLESTFGKDITSAIKVYGGKARYKGAMRAALPLYLAKMKGGEGIDKFEELVGDKKFQKRIRQSVDAIAGDVPYMLEDFAKHKRGLVGDEQVGKLIQKTLVKSDEEMEFKTDKEGNFKDKDVRSMVENKVTIDGKEITELLKTKDGREKVAIEAVNKKLVGALKVSDIDTLSPETVSDEKFQEMVARYKDWNFIRRLATEKGVDLEKIQKKAEDIDLREVYRTNPTFVRAAYTSGGKHIMRPWQDEEGKALKYFDPSTEKKEEITKTGQLRNYFGAEKIEKALTPVENIRLWGITEDEVLKKVEQENISKAQATRSLIKEKKKLMEKPSAVKGVVLGKLSKERRKEGEEKKEEEEKLIKSLKKGQEKLKKEKESIKELREKLKSLEDEEKKGHSVKVLTKIKREIKENRGKLTDKERKFTEAWSGLGIKWSDLKKTQEDIKGLQQEELRRRSEVAETRLKKPTKIKMPEVERLDSSLKKLTREDEGTKKLFDQFSQLSREITPKEFERRMREPKLTEEDEKRIVDVAIGNWEKDQLAHAGEPKDFPSDYSRNIYIKGATAKIMEEKIKQLKEQKAQKEREQGGSQKRLAGKIQKIKTPEITPKKFSEKVQKILSEEKKDINIEEVLGKERVDKEAYKYYEEREKSRKARGEGPLSDRQREIMEKKDYEKTLKSLESEAREKLNEEVKKLALEKVRAIKTIKRRSEVMKELKEEFAKLEEGMGVDRDTFNKKWARYEALGRELRIRASLEELTKKPRVLPKIRKDAPKHIKSAKKEGEDYLSLINKNIKNLKVLEKETKEIEDKILSLKLKKTAEGILPDEKQRIEDLIKETGEKLSELKENIYTARENIIDSEDKLEEKRETVKMWKKSN